MVSSPFKLNKEDIAADYCGSADYCRVAEYCGATGEGYDARSESEFYQKEGISSNARAEVQTKDRTFG